MFTGMLNITGDYNNGHLSNVTTTIRTTELLYMVFRGIWTFLAVTGNSMTIYAVYKFDNLQTITNHFVVSLALADLIP